MFKMLPLLVLPFLSLSNSTSSVSNFDFNDLGGANGTLVRKSNKDFTGYTKIKSLLNDSNGLFNQSAYGITPITDDASLYQFLSSGLYAIDPLAIYFNYQNLTNFNFEFIIQDSYNAYIDVDSTNGRIEFIDSPNDIDFDFNLGVYHYYTGTDYFSWSNSYFDIDAFGGSIDFYIDCSYLSSTELNFSFDSSGNLNNGSASVNDIDLDTLNKLLLTWFVPYSYYSSFSNYTSFVWRFMSNDSFLTYFDDVVTTNNMKFFDSVYEHTDLGCLYPYYSNTENFGFSNSLSSVCDSLDINTISSSLISFDSGNYELTSSNNDFYNSVFIYTNSNNFVLTSLGMYMLWRFADCYNSELQFYYNNYLHFISNNIPTILLTSSSDIANGWITINLQTPIYLTNLTLEPITSFRYILADGNAYEYNTYKFFNSDNETIAVYTATDLTLGNILFSGAFSKDIFVALQYNTSPGYIVLTESYNWTNLIYSYGNLPIYYLRQLLSFEILGTSLFSVLASFVTVVMVLFVIRKLL